MVFLPALQMHWFSRYSTLLPSPPTNAIFTQLRFSAPTGAHFGEGVCMFMIVEQGGFQFKVSQGDTIRVPRIQAEKGQEVLLDKVLLVSDGDVVKVGTPVVAGAQVKASVVDHGKDDKVLIIKKRRREDYKRKNGHRQGFTMLQITAVTAQ